MIMSKKRLVLSGLALVIAFQVPAIAAPKVEEVAVGPAGRDIPRHVSASGLRVATILAKGSRFAVLIDGVEEQPVDEILSAAATVQISRGPFGEIMSRNVAATFPVAFSPDSKRYAYAARISDQIVVIRDGKEVFRTKNMLGSLPRVQFLTFTPDSKRFYFNTATTDTMSSVALWMDGEIGPAAAELIWPVFSDDGVHYAYASTRAKAPAEKFVVLDGQEMPYAGGRPSFTRDGKLVAMQQDTANPSVSLLVDGKPILKTPTMTRYVLNPATDTIAAIGTRSDGKSVVFVDGKESPGTEGAYDVIFSPDGQRWAATCATNGLGWMVIDGKKGADYARVTDAGFTADSSKVVYVAEAAGGKKFVVTEGVESDGCTHIFQPPIYSPKGAGVAFNGGPEPMMGRGFVVNGKAYPPGRYSDYFQFSDDGEHFLYLTGGDIGWRTLVVDGQDKSSFGLVFEGFKPVISRDGKHYASLIRTKTAEMVLIDDKLVSLPPSGGAPRWLAFSPDGNHLYWWSHDRTPDGKTIGGLYVDGERATTFDPQNLGMLNNLWEFNDDGSLTMLGSAGDAIKRATVTASADRSIASIITDHDTRVAAASAAEEKAKADADAAALKAQQDVQVAKDAAAAKRAADAEAKKKAREDAALAKQKAREEALKKKAEQAR